MNRHATRTELEVYVQGLLEGGPAAELEAHCASCGACAEALAREASLELAFEQVARAAPAAPVRRSVRKAAYGGAAGLAAMAAVALLWLGRGATSVGEGTVAAGGHAATLDGEARDGRSDALDGG